MPALGLDRHRRLRFGSTDLGRARRRPGHLALGAPAPWWRGDHARLIRWVAVLGLGLLAAGLVTSVAGRAQSTLAGYGARRLVPMASRDLLPGHRISSGDIEWRQLPTAALPSDLLDRSPAGSVVVDRVARGEILSGARVAPGGLSPLAAQVDPGHRAVAIPQRAGALDLAVGDRVDIVSPASAGASALDRSSGGDGTAGDGRVVARACLGAGLRQPARGGLGLQLRIGGGGRRPGPGPTAAGPRRGPALAGRPRLDRGARRRPARPVPA